MKPLEGVRVIDFTHAYSGVYGAQILADLGAYVVKVEPIGGEQSRIWPPFSPDFGHGKRSCYYAAFNRNKTNISLDLKSKEGLEIAYELIKESDILMVNMRNGAMDKLGLGYDDAKKINPKLVYATLNGYGSRGPFKDLKAYDNVTTAYSGIMYCIGDDEKPPMKTGISIGDNYSGLTIFSSVLHAYICAKRTGQGQLVEVAMQDCLFGLLDNQILKYSMDGETPKRVGNAFTQYAPEDVFRTAGPDNYVALAIHTEDEWIKFCNTLEKKEWIEDERFKNNALRKTNYDALRPLIAKEFIDKDHHDLQEKFLHNGVSCVASNRISDLLREPQYAERHMMRFQPDVQTGHMQAAGNPMKFSDTDCEEIKTSKYPGQDNEKVFGKIGYTTEEIDKLYEKKIIYKEQW